MTNAVAVDKTQETLNEGQYKKRGRGRPALNEKAMTREIRCTMTEDEMISLEAVMSESDGPRSKFVRTLILKEISRRNTDQTLVLPMPSLKQQNLISNLQRTKLDAAKVRLINYVVEAKDRGDLLSKLRMELQSFELNTVLW